MRPVKLLILFLITPLFIKAQESYGALHSNYSPTNSVHLNVTSMLDAKVWLDIEIVGLNTYAINNFIALKNTTYTKTVKEILAEDFNENDLTFNQGKNRYHFYNRTFLKILSATWNKGNHAIGLSFSGASYTSVRNFNDPIAKFIENGISNYTEQHLKQYSLKNFRITSVAYGEMKLSYANTFYKRNKDMFMIGASYKKIFPLAGVGVNIRNLEYEIDNDSTLSVANFKGDIMNSSQPIFSIKGGWGVDLGFTYQKMEKFAGTYFPNSKRGGCERNYYKYKIGISINDIGYAKFNSDNIDYRAFDLSLADFNYVDIDAELTDENVPAFVDGFVTETSGIVKKPNKISLPTYLSFQYDLKLFRTFVYINATWVQSLAHKRNTFSIRRANSIAITPRIETKIVDFALPFSLYEYSKPQLGASLRLYFLTIGTDKLLSHFVKSDIYGADFYFDIKIPLFRSPKCKNGGGSFSAGKGKKRGRGKKPPCDAYR